MTPHDIAKKIARRLFTNGSQEQAQRLVLTIDQPVERNLGGWSEVAAVDQIEKELKAALAPKEFHNTKWSGEGFGQIGTCRVVIRRERKGGQRTYVQIIDDTDGMGIGFTAKEIEALVPVLQQAAKAAWQAHALPASDDAVARTADDSTSRPRA